MDPRRKLEVGEEALARLEARAAEPPRERKPLERAQRERIWRRVRGSSERAYRAKLSATGTSDSAAGSGPMPGAIASAKARSVRSSAALSPGRRLQVGAATGATLPESDHSNSATPTRKPSTMKLSR